MPAGTRLDARPPRAPAAGRGPAAGRRVRGPGRRRARPHRLSQAAAEAAPLAEANKIRTALLAAVGHDLRTPLAAAKAAVASLRSIDVDLDAEDRRELLQAADDSLDRLAAAGRQPARHEPAPGRRAVDRPAADRASTRSCARALDDLGADGRTVVDRRHPTTSRWCRPTPGCSSGSSPTWSPTPCGTRPPSDAAAPDRQPLGDRVEIRVIDRGPGIPADDRDQVFPPFQRLGDTDNTTGVGLGLALSRGLTEAMGGTLEPEETPGGGLTMVVSLPTRRPSDAPDARPPAARERDEAAAVTRVLVVDDEPQLAARAEHQPARPPLRGA